MVLVMRGIESKKKCELLLLGNSILAPPYTASTPEQKGTTGQDIATLHVRYPCSLVERWRIDPPHV